MNITSKIVIVSALSVLFTQVALGLSDTNQSNNPGDYSVIALKDCQIVSEHPMTAKQLDAYLNLQKEEQKMQTLELPIQNIEEEIKVYTDEMEKLTELAIQETDESLHINKKLLAQHELVAKEFNQFMQLHQHNFDALGQQGSEIGQKAKIFETRIKANLGHVVYDQIQISTPTKQAEYYGCDTGIKISVI